MKDMFIGKVRHKRNLLSQSKFAYALVHAAVKTLHSVHLPHFQCRTIEASRDGSVHVRYYVNDIRVTALNFEYNSILRKWEVTTPLELRCGYDLAIASDVFDEENAVRADTSDVDLVLNFAMKCVDLHT